MERDNGQRPTTERPVVRCRIAGNGRSVLLYEQGNVYTMTFSNGVGMSFSGDLPSYIRECLAYMNMDEDNFQIEAV